MAVMPSITYTAATSTLSPVSPHYSSKFVETSPSGLDPNASVYQPMKKWMPTLVLPGDVAVPKASHRSVSCSPRWNCIVWDCYLLSLKTGKKKKKEHLDRLELPIRFSCKFLEDLTELCNLFSLANALKTILGFQVANFAFLCTCAWFPLENTGLCLILNPFFSLLFFFFNNRVEFANQIRWETVREKPFVLTAKGLNNPTKLCLIDVFNTNIWLSRMIIWVPPPRTKQSQGVA